MIPLLSQAAMRGPPAGAGGDDVREVHVARFHVVEFQKRGLPHAHLLPTGPRWAMWPKELRSFRLQVWGDAMRRAQMAAGQPVRHGDAAGRNTKGRRKRLTRRKGKRK